MSEASLQEMLQQRSLPVKRLQLAILRQIADQLRQANQRGLVHGNLTPQSVMVSMRDEGEGVSVFVRDFGTQFILDPTGSNDPIPLNAYYLSPEQVLGIDVSPQSDEFSFAVIAYEMLGGRRPFTAAKVSGLIFAICSDTPAALHELDAALTSGVSDVVNRALAKDREQRYANSVDFMTALERELVQCEGWNEVKPEPEPVAIAAAAASTSQHHAEPFVPLVQPPAAVWNPAPSFEPEPRPNPVAYELPPIRRKRRYDDDEEDIATGTSPVKKFAIAGLILFALAAGGVFFLNRSSKPDLPTQVLETSNGPVSPPPADTAAPKPESALQQPPVSTPKQSAPLLTAPKQSAPTPPVSTARSPTRVSKPAQQVRTAAPAKAPGRQPGNDLVDVELLSDPPGAQMTVDNNPVMACRAPCTISLSTGRHTLTASLAGYTMAQRIFNVPETSSVFVTIPRLSGVLVVTSNPSATTVLVDGKDYGLTPATLHLPPGQHRITLMNGSQRHDEIVTVVADGIQATGYTFPR